MGKLAKSKGKSDLNNSNKTGEKREKMLGSLSCTSIRCIFQQVNRTFASEFSVSDSFCKFGSSLSQHWNLKSERERVRENFVELWYGSCRAQSNNAYTYAVWVTHAYRNVCICIWNKRCDVNMCTCTLKFIKPAYTDVKYTIKYTSVISQVNGPYILDEIVKLSKILRTPCKHTHTRAGSEEESVKGMGKSVKGNGNLQWTSFRSFQMCFVGPNTTTKCVRTSRKQKTGSVYILVKLKRKHQAKRTEIEPPEKSKQSFYFTNNRMQKGKSPTKIVRICIFKRRERDSNEQPTEMFTPHQWGTRKRAS